MLRISISIASFVLASCVSLSGNELRVGRTFEPRAGVSTAAEVSEVGVPPLPSAGPALPPIEHLAEPSVLIDPPRPRSLGLAEEGLRHSRFTIKGGYYSAEDAEELDDGYIFNVSWMRFFTSLLALELEVGYLDADGEAGNAEAEVYGIPIMVNGRANIPVWILDLYGGLGVGTIYYDAELDAGALSAEDDGFLAAGNAFLGATINLADAIALGLEAKYYVSEEIDDVDTTLEAFAVMLTLGFSR